MFPLLRLPAVAAKEVFKLMAPKELFLISVLSKRAKLKMQSSIPRNFFSVLFTIGSFHVEMKPFRLYISSNAVNCNRDNLYRIGTEKVCFSSNYTYCHWVSTDCIAQKYNHERYTGSIIKHFVEALNNPVAELRCYDGTKEWQALELFKYLKVRNLKNLSARIMFDMSPEGYTTVLNECNSIQFLSMRSQLPWWYGYRPPREFRTDKLIVERSTHWVSLEDFLQCKEIEVARNWTPQDLNSFFKKVITTDCRLEKLKIPFDDATKFRRAVQGLSDEPIEQGNKVTIQKKDGKKLRIYLKREVLEMRLV